LDLRRVRLRRHSHFLGHWAILVRLWLPLTGRLPWRLHTFLDDAYDRGVLRQTGPVWEFRHDRLQQHLSETAHSRPERKLTASVRGARPRTGRASATPQSAGLPRAPRARYIAVAEWSRNVAEWSLGANTWSSACAGAPAATAWVIPLVRRRVSASRY
jgi:hypothetical protein